LAGREKKDGERSSGAGKQERGMKRTAALDPFLGEKGGAPGASRRGLARKTGPQKPLAQKKKLDICPWLGKKALTHRGVKRKEKFS